VKTVIESAQRCTGSLKKGYTDGAVEDGAVDETNRLKESIYETAQELVEIAKKHRVTIGAAESCSGGAVASAITSVPGCSDVFKGAVVSYANEAKTALLDVDEALLASAGAVDGGVALQMARGALRALKVDFALSTTGIAGPDGGSEHKPVGTVWIAVAGNATEQVTLYHFAGTREHIRQATAKKALQKLTDFIQGAFG